MTSLDPPLADQTNSGQREKVKVQWKQVKGQRLSSMRAVRGKHHLTFGGTALSCAQLVQAGAGYLPHDDVVTVSSMDGRLGQVPVLEGSWVAHQQTQCSPA